MQNSAYNAARTEANTSADTGHLPKQVVLTEAEKLAVRSRAIQSLGRVVLVQSLSVLFAVVACWLVFGWQAGASALVGAGAYYLPNVLFAIRLMVGMLATRPVGPLGFMLGEFAKLGGAVALLGGAAYMWHTWLVWPAVLFGLVCVLKGYVLLLVSGRLS